VVGKVAFPGWDDKFLLSGMEEENQWQGKSMASPYKYHPDDWTRIFKTVFKLLLIIYYSELIHKTSMELPDRALYVRSWGSPVSNITARPVDADLPVVLVVPGATGSVNVLLDTDLLRACLMLDAVVIVNLLTFLWDWNAIIRNLGPNRQTRATEALKVTDKHSVVSWTWHRQRDINWQQEGQQS